MWKTVKMVWLNSQSTQDVVNALLACCDVPRWAESVAAGCPYPSVDAAVATAEAAAIFTPDELERALRAHPRIGERAEGFSREAAWSREEHSAAGVNEANRDSLLGDNAAYEQRFGHVFLICATGLSAAEIQTALHERMNNTPEREAAVVANELRKIVALRVRKLVTDVEPRYLANCSMLFTELPVLQRAEAARAAGFDAIEFWWPWPTATPTDGEVDAFVSSIKDAGIQLVGLNFFAGDLAGPDCGMASIPGRSVEFRDSVDIAVAIGTRLGIRAFNALYGVRVDGVSPAEQDALARENLAQAATAAAAVDATVLIESVSGPKPYPLRTAADSLKVVHDVRAGGHANIGFLLDLFHLAANGDDIDAAIANHTSDVSHVQIADFPGRGEPGSASLDLQGHLATLHRNGYMGWVGLEYKPTTGNTLDSLAWLPRERRGAST